MIAPRARQTCALCPLCHAPQGRLLVAGHCEKLYRCRACGVDFAQYAAALDVENSRADHFGQIDREQYERSVGKTRRRSYRRLLDHVGRFVPRGSWLDVGCSYGWLLEFVAERGYRASGVDPSPSACEFAQRAGLRVSQGACPEALAAFADQDVVSFIDVLEHLPDPEDTLVQLRDRLTTEGVVVIQVPDQSCLLYRTAEVLARTTGGRINFALRRLWLADLDFPHRFYFTRNALLSLLERAEYEVLDQYRSSISSPAEARDRVGYYRAGQPSTGRGVALAVGAINAIDAAVGRGGLLTVIARPRT